MAEEGWTGLDRWVTSNDNSTIAEQTVRLTQKGKCTAFGEAVIGSGRAEWDLTIEFESFGGISIGIFRQNLRDRDNINALPTDETFTYTPDGYGYANKTGVFTCNRERKKYGKRYRHGDKITVRLDLQARVLSFLVNDEDQGVAYDGLPKGAFRLAACMQFNEQKVSITRFWTSLGKDATIPNIESTKTQTAAQDKKGKEHEVEEKEEVVESISEEERLKQEKAKQLYSNYTEPEIDPDAPLFGDNYDSGGDGDDAEAEEEDTDNNAPRDLATKSGSFDQEELEQLKDLEKQKPEHGQRASLEDLNQNITEQYGTMLQNIEDSSDDDNESNSATNTSTDAVDAVGLIGGRSRGLSKVDSKAPEPLSIESVDEDATDYFSLSGSNIKTDRNTVTCTRGSGKDGHSAFGTQLVSRGRIEWMLRIETGHSIRIGVCGACGDATDRVFTETKYGYGYGDDGNIYFGGSHIEYNDGFKAGDIIGVYLNMDMNTLKFSVNGADHGAAFNSIKLNEKDNINGYRLAVTLQHRPHKVTLLESTLYNVERRSPRPSSTHSSFSLSQSNGGHKRKLSYSTMNNNQLKKVGIESEEKEKKKPQKSEESKEETETRKNGKKAKKTSQKEKKKVNEKKSKKKEPKANGASKKKKAAAASTKNGKKVETKKKTGKTSKDETSKKKKKSQLRKPEDDEKTDDSGKKKLQRSKSPRLKSKGNVNWTKKENVTKDKWEGCGAKLEIEKSAVTTKANIKDGNSAFGKLIVKGNKAKCKWEITIKQGDNIGVGVCNISGGLKTPKNKKLLAQSFTNDINGYGYMGNDGGIQRSGRYKKYGEKFKAGDKVSIILDLHAKTLSFELNGNDQGTAFKNLPSGEYRIAASFFERSQKITLNKTTIWEMAK